MPHARLQLQGGVNEQDTPVINTAGVAVSNRIRFKYDPLGLSLPEKLGGWAKFFANTITSGIARAMWGWQDTNNNQWIGLGLDSTTTGQLDAIQCTVNGTTGLTSATGSLMNITPNQSSAQSTIGYAANLITPLSLTGNSYGVVLRNTGISTLGQKPGQYQVYIVVPIAVGGVILSGLVPITYDSGGPGATNQSYIITAVDILGNPLYPQFLTEANVGITSVGFTGGTPNTLTIHYSVVSYTVAVGDNVNIVVADNSITGSYIVLSSNATSFVVATTLSSYTFATTGIWNNAGVTPIFNTVSASNVITVVFPFHGLPVGADFTVLTPTLVGGLTIEGLYVVQSVANSYTFTISSPTAATATSHQYQGAISSITNGTANGTTITLNYTDTVTAGNGYSAFTNNDHVFVQGVNPSGWNGTFTATSASNDGTLVYTSAATAGSWVSGGSFSPIGGLGWFIYSWAVPGSGSATQNATFWTLDSWGNDLIAVAGNAPALTFPSFTLQYQPILYWDPTGAFGNAQAIANGPLVSVGAFVAMPQRQIIAWGSSFNGIIDPLLIRWCDINNFNTWVAQVINQAGSFRLPSGAAIIGGRQLPQQGLIWTDIELWSMQYINQPYVYSFNKIGQGCGLIGKYAHGVLGGITYWMAKTQCFMLSGGGVVSIPCPIWDVVFQELDLVNVDKITCATNSMFQEVTWYFPVKGGNGENSQYIKLNVSGLAAGQPPLWDYGTLDRSAWIDVSVLQQPIGFSPANHLIYQHEISPDADGAAMGESFTTGWFALSEGDVMPFIDQIWPDMHWGYFGQSQNANVMFTLSGQDYPGQSAQTVGPYTISQSTTYISPRMRHRMLSFTVSGTGTGTWWRLGGIRYRFQPDGKF